MNIQCMKSSGTLVLLLALILAVPLSAHGKKKSGNGRGILEKMDAVPCGAKETGLSGLGALWGSVGVTHINSNEKLCPQYLLRTDEMDYEIRPIDLKHATILPIGKEGEFQIRKNEMILTMTAGADQKPRDYEVVSMNPANADSSGASSSSSSDATPDSSGTKSSSPSEANPSGNGAKSSNPADDAH